MLGSRSPGTTWGARRRIISYTETRDYLTDNSVCLEALGSILSALLKPNSASHPDLAKRWSTTLDWYAEGHREQSYAVVLAKMATSLDVLACGGKYAGILDMVSCLLGLDKSKIIVKGRFQLTLEQVVKNIYEKCRSKILHGTEFDRIKSFEAPRSHAAVLTRLVLLESAIRLKNFSGHDEDKEFRRMPA